MVKLKDNVKDMQTPDPVEKTKKLKAFFLSLQFSVFSLCPHRRRGQAMTEVVLLFPMFMLIVFLTAKMFALLILVQKMEIASYYAARRWQLESHLNADFAAGWDETFLKPNIEKKTSEYLGYDKASVRKFLNLKGTSAKLDIVRTQVWNVVTLTVETDAAGIQMLCKYPREVVCAAPYGADCNNGYDYLCAGGKQLQVVKYVPNRDRPIQFVLPGLK
ncbi:MAG: hypothetical protein A2270_06070 [Elusimicrobia bacterium RIFOXYA12_FULL_51_18]|nr:MAG: hypothetical protein A2270_06070 [Elusimicrobia bacterium RIFOXYA12_FULL_51_18]OGS30493.1 MAG: hypothetical protein A2218_04235 [Elusimicrobia bacterium RIFOXYA2_FULL_53_38]